MGNGNWPYEPFDVTKSWYESKFSCQLFFDFKGGNWTLGKN
ncbi:hypothetical protein NT03LS_0075 [Listeria seeligeri FSL N1-067]|uniref:Uncharacterized protein n=1 Tax=Listeria seeligeri FSL N1-067 TaxID=702453 RepID=E3ZKY7_LISSE|nr:hypothetical protein NT03LS_0075 [Listeria seeligeri FSL N1-067]